MMKNNIKKDTICVVGISCGFILLLSSVMVLSPWSYKFDNDVNSSVTDVYRGDDEVFGESVDPESELTEITYTIESLSSHLPSYSYFDRFYSKEKREEFKDTRTEIYELQWKRIQLLQKTKRYEMLIELLEDYVKIIGHHQADADRMLNLLNSKKD